MRTLKRPASWAWLMAAATVALAAGVLAAGPWSLPQAEAKTITAKCANAGTDAATLNAAITGSKPGDEILISGHCLLTSPVTLLGDRSYLGGSRTGTVLQQASGANLPYLLASDSYVSNATSTGDPFAIHQLTINCNGTNNTAPTDGLVIRSWQTQAYDLQIETCKGDGILVTNRGAGGAQLTPPNTQVNGSITSNFIADSGISGVFVYDDQNVVTDWHLAGNYIAGAGQDAIHLDNAAGWYIDGNHLYDGDKNGTPLNHDAIYASRLFGTSISGNYIEDFGRSGGTTTWYGIDGTVQGDAASTITGNRVFMFQPEAAGTSYDYIAVTQVNYVGGGGDVAVTGNTIRGAGSAADTGFYFNAGPGKTLAVTSSGNLVTSVGTARSTGTGVTVTAGI
jgi:hypothetical protein